jgi:hypothetical protein
MDPACSESSRLHQLPNELLMIVLEVLPLPSAATLALTSKRMFRFVDDFCAPFAALNRPGNEFERAKFLLSFDAFYPKKQLCFACGRFHPRHEMKLQMVRRRSFERRVVVQYQCARADAIFPEGIEIEREIWRWSDFHEVMRGFRHSPKHGDPRRLIQYHPPGNPQYWFEALWARETLVVPADNHLLLRQRWTRGIPCPKGVNYAFPMADLLCPHAQSDYFRDPAFYRAFFDLLRRAVDHSETFRHDFQKDKTYSRGIVYKAVRCSECATEIVVEILPTAVKRGQMVKDFRRLPRVLSVTRYMDLGPCKSPDESQWKNLTRFPSRVMNIFNCNTYDTTRSTLTLYGSVGNFASENSVAYRMGEQTWRQPQVPHEESVTLPGEEGYVSDDIRKMHNPLFRLGYSRN